MSEIKEKEKKVREKTIGEEISQLEIGLHHVAKAQRILGKVDLDRIIEELDN